MSTETKLYTAEEAAALLGKPQQIARTARQKPISWVAADEREKQLGEQFRQDTSGHQMTVKLDQGLYRHLRFSSNPKGYGEYWFDLITWPGCLTVRGDYGNAYTFARLADMFEFFRSDRGGINAHYWSEKLDGGRSTAKTYSQDLFRQLVVEHFVDAVRYSDAPRGLGKAIREQILNQDLYFEEEARSLLESFEYKGFEFGDVWEWNFHDFERDFLWACHAIVWGIAQYDAAIAVREPKPGEQLVTVSFDVSCGLEPLTTRATALADDVPRYLRRTFTGPLTVAVEDDQPCGRVLAGEQLVATFTLAPLGGAA